MHRIEGTGVDADLFGTGKDGFTEGNPIAGEPRTEVSDDFMNATQEEIANVAEAYTPILTADTDTRDQMDRAIRERAAMALASTLASKTVTIGADIFLDIASEMNIVIAVGEDGRVQQSSNYGRTFSAPSGTGSDDLRAVAIRPPTGTLADIGGMTLAAVAVGASNAVLYAAFTPAALAGSWAAPSGPIAGVYRDVCYAGVSGQFVAVGDNGLIARGTSGSWTDESIVTANAFLCVESSIHRITGASLGTVIAAGTGGMMYRSTDGGASFTLVTSFTGSTIENLAFDTVSGRWWAMGTLTAGLIAYSDDDGVTWTVTDSGSLYVLPIGVVAIAGGLLFADYTSGLVMFLPRTAAIADALVVGECVASTAHMKMSFNHRSGLLAMAGEADLIRLSTTRAPGLR